MRRMYDIRCLECGKSEDDRYIDLDLYRCPECGGSVEKVMKVGHALGCVVGDDIPGGVDIEHGICHPDGTPKKYYSKTEIRRACKEQGFKWGYDTNRHIPLRGSDKSPFTSKW